MKEKKYLPQSQLNGIWKASYANVEQIPDYNADAEKQTTIKFDEGLLSGDDPFGGRYVGRYSVREGKFSARVEVTSVSDAAQSILGIAFPHTLDFFGNYSSPDQLSIMGKVVGMDKQVIVNCSRIKEDK